MNKMMNNNSRTSGWMIGADTACRADAIVINTTQNYLTWTQDQIGTSTGTWPFMGRYLTEVSGINNGLTVESNGEFVSTGELQTILDNGTAVVLVDNRGTNYGWGINGSNGAFDAQKAKDAASALGIPNDIYIFVDVETDMNNLGNYLSNYKNVLESGSVKYKMGVYCSSAHFGTISNSFDLSNTFTWIANWNDSYVYPDWPDEYPSSVANCGQVKIWQFIDDQYSATTNYGTAKLDLNLSTASYADKKMFMYHPYF